MMSTFLHRLLIKLRAELATGADAQAQGNHWSEFVADLWNAHLPHLREETFGDEEFVFDPFTNRYGFEDQSYYSSDDELFMHDLENDGYDEVVMEGFGIDLAERDSFVEMDESISQPQVTHSYDLAQSTDEEEESDVEDVILSPQPNEEDMACELWSYERVFNGTSSLSTMPLVTRTPTKKIRCLQAYSCDKPLIIG